MRGIARRVRRRARPSGDSAQPLDVLAQQIVAEVAAAEWSEPICSIWCDRVIPMRTSRTTSSSMWCACWRRVHDAARSWRRLRHRDAVNGVLRVGVARASPR